MKTEEIVQSVLDCLDQHGSIDSADWDDPRVSDFVIELRKVEARHELGEDHDIFIDLDVPHKTVSIFKASTSEPAKPKRRAKKKKDESKTAPAAAPPVDRTKHTYTPPPFSDSVVKIIKDSKPHNLWFWGPTGSGKTVYVAWLGAELNRKVYRINCREDMTSETFLGDQTLGFEESKSGDIASVIKYCVGQIEKAMTEGLDENGNEVGEPAFLYIDEIATAPSQVCILLNPLLENDTARRTITIDMDGGRKVTSHSGFRVIFSANTQGKGATSVLEAGYTAQHNALDSSLLNRMTCYFRFGYDKMAEKRILQEKIGNDRIVSQVLKFRDSIRSEIKQGRLTTLFSTRNIVAIGDMYRVLGSIEEALYRTVFEAIKPEALAKYNEMANLHIGKDLLSKFQGGTNFDYM